jgi:hypothetical protein
LRPAVIRLLNDPQLLHNLTDRLTAGNLHLRFSRLADDLLRLKSLLGHPVFAPPEDADQAQILTFELDRI